MELNNINNTVEVELTEFGLKILNEKWRNVRKYANQGLDKPMKLTPPGLEGNIYRTSLWEIMHTFGPYSSMGNFNQCFVNNKIKVISNG